jgi:hypothetical protein
VDLEWISVDLEWISVDLGPCELRDWTRENYFGTWTNMWTSTSEKSKAGIGSNELHFFGVFPLRLSFGSVWSGFLWVRVDFCGLGWISVG